MWPAAWRRRWNIALPKTSFCRAEADYWMLFINTVWPSLSGIGPQGVIFSFRTLRHVPLRSKPRIRDPDSAANPGYLIERTFPLWCLGNNALECLRSG